MVHDDRVARQGGQGGDVLVRVGHGADRPDRDHRDRDQQRRQDDQHPRSDPSGPGRPRPRPWRLLGLGTSATAPPGLSSGSVSLIWARSATDTRGNWNCCARNTMENDVAKNRYEERTRQVVHRHTGHLGSLSRQLVFVSMTTSRRQRAGSTLTSATTVHEPHKIALWHETGVEVAVAWLRNRRLGQDLGLLRLELLLGQCPRVLEGGQLGELLDRVGAAAAGSGAGAGGASGAACWAWAPPACWPCAHLPRRRFRPPPSFGRPPLRWVAFSSCRISYLRCGSDCWRQIRQQRVR